MAIANLNAAVYYINSLVGKPLVKQSSVVRNIDNNIDFQVRGDHRDIEEVRKLIKAGLPTAKFDSYTDHHGIQMTFDINKKQRVTLCQRWDEEIQIGLIQFN